MCYVVGFFLKSKQARMIEEGLEKEATQNLKHYRASKLVVEQKKRKSGNEGLLGNCKVRHFR